MSGKLDIQSVDLDENGIEIIETLESEPEDEVIEALEAPAKLLRQIINPEPC